jgi:4-alpha-glucanotransferase
MKGGFWRNFLVKYPEINSQHKKMLRVHNQIADAQRLAEERGDVGKYGDFGKEDLWRGQSNDTYWHGLFGGIYMTDVRVRVQSYLLRAQAAAERAIYGDQNWITYETTDFDLDSLHELLVEGNALNIYIDLAEGGSIFEWDLRANNFNLASTLTRRPEGYHETLREYEEERRKKAAKRKGSGIRDQGSVVAVNSQHSVLATQEASHPTSTGSQTAPVAVEEGEPLSPHEAVRVKEEGLDRYLSYDRYRRACMIDHFLGPGTTLEGFIRSEYNEEGDFATGAYTAEIEPSGKALHVVLERNGRVNTPGGTKPVRVSKRIVLRPGSPGFRVLYTIQNLGDEELTAVFGSEWNVNLLGGGHNPSAYYRVEGLELEDAALDSTGEVRSVREIAVGNSWLEIEVACRLSHEATFWRFPIETVSGSEAGFERNYQGSCLLFQWLLKLSPSDSLHIELEWLKK